MLACLALLLLAEPTEKPKLVMLDLEVSGVEPQAGVAFDEAISSEIARQGVYSPLTAREIQAMLGAERQRQLTGCSEGNSCLIELAGALGQRMVMRGTLSKLGSAYQLSLQTLDTEKNVPVGRSIRVAKDLDALREELPWAVADATGAPLPAPPSRVLQITAISAGGLFVVAGGLAGAFGLSRSQALSDEIDQAKLPGHTARSYDALTQQRSQIVTIQITAAVGLAVGAALIASGILFWPKAGRAQLAFVPSSNGMALVALW